MAKLENDDLLVVVLGFLIDAVAAKVSADKALAQLSVALDAPDPVFAVNALRKNNKAKLDAAQVIAQSQINS